MIGHQRTAEIIYHADFLNAEDVKNIGLINEVVPTEKLDERIRKETDTLARKPPEALQESKRLLRASYRDELVETIEAESKLFHEHLNSDEARECMKAIREGREPDFS